MLESEAKAPAAPKLDGPRPRASIGDVFLDNVRRDEMLRQSQAQAAANEAKAAEAAEKEARLAAARAESAKLLAEKRAAQRSETDAPAAGDAAAVPAKKKHMTTAQLKQALRAAGVEPPEGAARADLEALLNRV